MNNWRLTAIIAFFPILCMAQDIHFSMPWFSAVNLNPALAESPEGGHKISAVYRQQWSSVPVPYITGAVTWDTHIKPIGLNTGISLFYDRAGDSRMSTFYAGVPIAYTQTINNNLSLSGGIMPALGQRRFDPSALSFDNQWNGDLYDGSLATGEAFSRTSFLYFDISAGVNVSALFNRTRVSLGGAVLHATKPQQEFKTVNTDSRLARQWNVYTEANIPLNDKVSLLPSVLFRAQSPHREFLAGSRVRYQLDNRPGRHLAVGAGSAWRVGDAVVFMLDLTIQDWTIGFSYDTNVSAFREASNMRGGPEIGVIRRFVPASEIICKLKPRCTFF